MAALIVLRTERRARGVRLKLQFNLQGLGLQDPAVLTAPPFRRIIIQQDFGAAEYGGSARSLDKASATSPYLAVTAVGFSLEIAKS
jgi:hypothetical protein